MTSRVSGIYRAMFLTAVTTKAIIPDPPRKAGQYEDDAEPKDEAPQAPKAVKTSSSDDQPHVQTGSLASQ
jgi:hypothetical protein